MATYNLNITQEPTPIQCPNCLATEGVGVLPAIIDRATNRTAMIIPFYCSDCDHEWALELVQGTNRDGDLKTLDAIYRPDRPE